MKFLVKHFVLPPSCGDWCNITQYYNIVIAFTAFKLLYLTISCLFYNCLRNKGDFNICSYLTYIKMCSVCFDDHWYFKNLRKNKSAKKLALKKFWKVLFSQSFMIDHILSVQNTFVDCFCLHIKIFNKSK